MRLDGRVGDAITNEARCQVRRLARLGRDQGMWVVNTDTDSVFESLCPVTCRTFSDMAIAENLDPTTTTYKQLLATWKEKAIRFCRDANAGERKPCQLELEKIFPTGITFYKKKNYTGMKLEGGKTLLHVSGLSAKKKTATKLLVGVQMACDRFLARNDLWGLLAFAQDICSLAMTEVSKETNHRTELAQLMNSIDFDNLFSEEAMKTRAQGHQLVSEHAGKSRRLPLDWLTSLEAVKFNPDPKIPKTQAAKWAEVCCKMEGMPRHKAPTLTATVRSWEVQVRTPVVKALEVVLMGASGKNTMGKKTQAALKKLEPDESKVTKLTVTGMPGEYRIPAEARVPVPPSWPQP